MLVIRFNRVGKRNKAQFRIVVQEHSVAPGGRHVEVVGSYEPHLKKSVLQEDRIQYWISKGAQPSPTVHNLLVSKGVIKGEKIAIKMKKKVKEGEEKSEEQKEDNKPVEEVKEEEKKDESSKSEEKPAEKKEAEVAQPVEEKEKPAEEKKEEKKEEVK